MTIWYETTGAGPAVVFLHAAIGDSRMWQPQWQAFSASHRLLRCDLRGFGRSEPIADPQSFEADVLACVDEAGIDSAVFVGGSMGGRVAMAIAVAEPQRVDGLVLACPALPGHQWSPQVHEVWRAEEAAVERGDIAEAVEVNLKMWLDGPGRDRADLSEPERALVFDMQRQALEHELAADRAQLAPPPMMVSDLAARLGEIAAPTLVTVGADDVGDMGAIAERIVSSIDDARIEVISDAAHLPSFERPDEFNRLLRNFLDNRLGADDA